MLFADSLQNVFLDVPGIKAELAVPVSTIQFAYPLKQKWFRLSFGDPWLGYGKSNCTIFAKTGPWDRPAATLLIPKKEKKRKGKTKMSSKKDTPL